MYFCNFLCLKLFPSPSSGVFTCYHCLCPSGTSAFRGRGEGVDVAFLLQQEFHESLHPRRVTTKGHDWKPAGTEESGF